eukprot:CAMPEP_0178990502 /NCGR_PEP_ID=MMETSP0795-20121207/4990_1 /TAXON_ID=88552 /ORGANISM="Amoebophrya sp., Strain Ameob2" /LENGTH=149 /DNA_ID=CAMNT_0020682071 /DNA_START=314 /DNA_END=760 /DNA_ORIENTATION=-
MFFESGGGPTGPSLPKVRFPLTKKRSSPCSRPGVLGGGVNTATAGSFVVVAAAGLPRTANASSISMRAVSTAISPGGPRPCDEPEDASSGLLRPCTKTRVFVLIRAVSAAVELPATPAFAVVVATVVMVSAGEAESAALFPLPAVLDGA